MALEDAEAAEEFDAAGGGARCCEVGGDWCTMARGGVMVLAVGESMLPPERSPTAPALKDARKSEAVL